MAKNISINVQNLNIYFVNTDNEASNSDEENYMELTLEDIEFLRSLKSFGPQSRRKNKGKKKK